MIRGAAIVVGVFALVWIGAIAFWRLAGASPGGLQMLLVLGALPLALLGAGFGIRAWRRRRAAAATAAPVADGASAPAPADELRPEAPVSWLLAGALRLPGGRDPAAALAALSEPRAPALHPRLRDRDGLPVFAAWVEDADAEAADALLEHHAPGLRVGPEQARAVALLDAVAEDLLLEAARLLPASRERGERIVAGMHHRDAPAASTRMRVHALLPAAWPAALREACLAALRERATACGLPPERVRLEAVPVGDARETWARLDLPAIGEGAAGDWHLLLACDSRIGERAVRRLEGAGQLMTARRQDGLLPAEGAAGALLAPTPDAAGTPPLAALHRAVRGETSLASLRAASRATADLLERTLRLADLPPERVDRVLSDADHRPARSVEATSAAAAACPELDTAAQCPALGVPNGDLGAVAPLAQLVLAGAHVRDAGQPVVALSVADERTRFALAMVPPAPSSPQSGAEAPAAAS